MTLTCPHCGFAKEVPEEKVPDRLLRVSCPKCQGTFSFAKPSDDLNQPPKTPPDSVGPGPEALPVYSATSPPTNARGVGELFRDAWEIYIRRVGALMGLYLLAILLMALPVGVFLLGGIALSLCLPDLKVPLLVASACTGLVAGSIGLFWGLSALVCAVVDEGLNIRAALEQGGVRVWAFAWVISLAGFIVTGGFFLFIIPGFLFSIWFCFAQFVLVAENEPGMRALLKSKAYVRGRFFDVLIRLLSIWGGSVLLGLIPVLGPILSLLFVPYSMIFTWLVFQDLRPVNGQVAFVCTSGEKAKWLLFGLLGFIIPLLVLFIALSILWPSLSGLTLPWPVSGGFGVLPGSGNVV